MIVEWNCKEIDKEDTEGAVDLFPPEFNCVV